MVRQAFFRGGGLSNVDIAASIPDGVMMSTLNDKAVAVGVIDIRSEMDKFDNKVVAVGAIEVGAAEAENGVAVSALTVEVEAVATLAANGPNAGMEKGVVAGVVGIDMVETLGNMDGVDVETEVDKDGAVAAAPNADTDGTVAGMPNAGVVEEVGEEDSTVAGMEGADGTVVGMVDVALALEELAGMVDDATAACNVDAIGCVAGNHAFETPHSAAKSSTISSSCRSSSRAHFTCVTKRISFSCN